MKNIFEEIIKEAKTKTVIIDNDPFNIGFNTIVTYRGKEIIRQYDTHDLPTLKINNYELFLNLLEKYVNTTLESNRKIPSMVFDKDKNTIKIIIASLLFNLSPQDFENPYLFLQNYINFYEKKLIDNALEISSVDSFFNSTLKISNSKTSIMMETPYKVEFELNKDNEKYKLPSIYYGIDNNDECYIYSIINPKNEQNTYQKKVKRQLYKINKGITITDVSPSAVLSLNIFVELLKSKNITKIKGVTYLPIRYNSREEVAENIEDEKRKNELIGRNQLIQTNITEKFIRTIEAVNDLNENLELIEIPFDNSDFISFNIKQKNNTSNIIIDEINNKIR